MIVDLAEARAARARVSADALAAARRMLGRRALSRSELDRRLADDGVDDADRAAVLARLEGESALDDAALAERVIAAERRKGRGWRSAQAALARRGLTAIDADIAAPDDDDELARATATLRRRGRVADDPRRTAAWLARRGFSGGVCRAAVESVRAGHADDT